MFQSQARSQSAGDRKSAKKLSHAQRSFNLRREANPLATIFWNPRSSISIKFQSQARSQSAGDYPLIRPQPFARSVSISGEKPIRWRQSRLALAQLQDRL